MPLVTQTPKKRRSMRLPLSYTTSEILQIIRGVHLKTETSKLWVFSKWDLKKFFKHVITNSLYRNSIFGMASIFILSGLGFVFWIIIAHLFKTENVGIATTLISIMTLLSSFTIMGLDSSLTRYLPKSSNRNELISSSFIIVTIATLLSSVIFFLGLTVFSPQLVFLRSNVFYILSFIIFTTFTSLNILVDSIFMAFRAAGNILIKNTIISISRLVFLFALIAFGSYGIFASSASAVTLGVLAGVFILYFKFHTIHSISFNISLVKKLSTYSLGNYIGIFMLNMPSLVLPVIILNIISAKYAAYFYFASIIQRFLLIIPMTTQQALLSEGSHNEVELKKHVKKAIATIFVILIPATAIAVLFGNRVLQFFGQNFALETFRFLQLYCISTLFTAWLLIASAILNVKHKIRTLVILNVFVAVLTLCLACAFISDKLVGIGWGWILGQAIAGLVSCYFIIRDCSGTPAIPSVTEQGSGGT